jgi:signal transduction histidine kinase
MNEGLPEHQCRINATLNKTLSIAVLIISENKISYHNAFFLELFEHQQTIVNEEFDPTRLFVESGTLQKLMLRADNTGEIRGETVYCKKSDGTKFWSSINFLKLEDEHGHYYSASFLDLTELHNKEKQSRERNEDLKKLNSQLDRFLYSASHDFRQPLTSMLGLIRLMQMENLGVTEKDYLGKIKSSVIKLDQFLGQIIEFSKNSHERVVSDRICLRKIIEKTIEKFQAQLQANRINLTIHNNSEVVFYSDENRISMMLSHLIKNSIDYCDHRKPDLFIKVLITCSEENAIIEIIDNGIGISKIHLEKVTEMFYRGTDRSRGSGLGLYLVNEAVLRLKGMLTIDSEPALGTMISIKIPNGTKGKLINKKRSLTRAANSPLDHSASPTP